MTRLILAASLLLLLTLAGIAWMDARRPAPVMLVPTLTGQPEYCLTCHQDVAQISPSHPTAAYGCVLCHGGERLALDADLAHSTLRGGANPSDPSVMAVSCGGANCHSGDSAGSHDQLTRLMTSPHMTYSELTTTASLLRRAGILPAGITAGMESRPTAALAGMALLRRAGFLPAGITAGMESRPTPEVCLACHLESSPLPGAVYARFTGCAACHTQPLQGDLSQPVHRLNTDIAYTQCNTCHNRGALDLAAHTFTPRPDSSTSRQQSYYLPGAPAATCEYRLDCVDCHTRGEVMGDGQTHASTADALSVSCSTCHGTLTSPPLTRAITQADDPALVQAAANPAMGLKAGDTIIVTTQGEPLVNTRALPDGGFSLVGKVTAQHNVIPLVQGSNCQQKPDQQSARDCHACHNSR